MLTRFDLFDRLNIPHRIDPDPLIDTIWQELVSINVRVSRRGTLTPISNKWSYVLRKAYLQNVSHPPTEESEIRRWQAYEQFAREQKTCTLKSEDFGADAIRKLGSLLQLPEAHRQFRRKRVFVEAGDKRYRSEFADPIEVEGLIQELQDWRNATKFVSPWAVAFGTHLIFLSIHPLMDGNGRMARAWEKIDFQNDLGCLLELIPPEVVAHWEYQSYEATILESRKTKILNPFVRRQMKTYLGFAKVLF